jgi:hypothetical protein
VQAFTEAFGRAEGAFIAEKLGYKTPQAVYKVIKGRGELGFEHLRKFKEETKRSIDWLLTGEEGPAGKEVENPYALTPAQLLFIRMLAINKAGDLGKKDVPRGAVNEVVRDVLFAGLDAKARELALAYRTMSARELEDALNILLPASDEQGAATSKAEDENSLRRDARTRR